MKLKALSILMAGAAISNPISDLHGKNTGNISVSGESVVPDKNMINVRADIILDSLYLDANRQIYLTPVITDAGSGNNVALPAVLINGKNMQYAIDRHVLKATSARYPELYSSTRRENGKPQKITYLTSAPLQDWMFGKDVALTMSVDSCGCGVSYGEGNLPVSSLDLNPADRMVRMYITPKVTETPVSIHEGKARVQFEVDRTELHSTPYRCKSGQMIDNRGELAVIDDSIHYALSDPNVEIAGIRICGYASPESPYIHNDMLATGRSKALAEYIAGRYNLPEGICSYDAVPENWMEFRDMVATSDMISSRQRTELLKLIDSPAYGPADYDAKEKTLKTNPEFASLYKNLILPEWFPKLRATKFEIKTRLKPLSDNKLAEVILSTPEKMSLNQMFRVANLYPEGSEDFNQAILTALKHYPDDTVAALNAAVNALNSGDIENAERLLLSAGDSPEAENARGILATYKGDFPEARKHFEAAGNLPEAVRNLKMLPPAQ